MRHVFIIGSKGIPVSMVDLRLLLKSLQNNKKVKKLNIMYLAWLRIVKSLNIMELDVLI